MNPKWSEIMNEERKTWEQNIILLQANLKILRAKSANLYFYNLKTIFPYLCYKAFKNIYLLILATCIIIFFSLVFYDFF